MIVLWILLGILALIALLLMTRVRFHVTWRDELTVTTRLLGFDISHFLEGETTPASVEYTPRTMRKKRKQAAKKRQDWETLNAQLRQKKDPLRVLALLRRFLRVILEKALGYLRVRVKHMRITVATGDPASTAVLFGAVNSAAIYLLEVLDRFGKLDGKRSASFSVKPDFLAKETEMDIYLVLSLTIWQVLVILYHAALDHLKQQQQEENKA